MLSSIFVLCQTVRLFLAAREENEIQIGTGPQLRSERVFDTGHFHQLS